MTLLLRMRNEMSQMQVGKMAEVAEAQEFVAQNVDLDAATAHLAASKSGQRTNFDAAETPTGSAQADVVCNKAVGASRLDDGGPAPRAEGPVSLDHPCAVADAAQCNHVGEPEPAAANRPSSTAPPSINSSDSPSCDVTDAAGGAERVPADVNISDCTAASERAAVTWDAVEPCPVATQGGPPTLAAVKGVAALQATAPGLPHGVTVPLIRTSSAVSLSMPIAAVTPSAALRTLAPRVMVSTSPATTVLRVQTAPGSGSTQPMPTVPSQQLLLPVRNQGPTVPRVLPTFRCYFAS